MWWHTVTHGRGIEEETGEWSGYPVPFTPPRNMVYAALLPLMRTPRLPVVDWTDAPADLNGLVRFGERRNLFSVHVPSHFNWPLLSLRLPEECHGANFVKALRLDNPPIYWVLTNVWRIQFRNQFKIGTESLIAERGGGGGEEEET